MRLEAYNKFEANDLRRDATIWDLRHLTGLPEDQSYHARYQNTFLWLNKYRPRPENNADATFDNNLNYNNNYRYYRYAEALLNAAELLLETSATSSSWAKANATGTSCALARLPPCWFPTTMAIVPTSGLQAKSIFPSHKVSSTPILLSCRMNISSLGVDKLTS